MTLAEPLSVIKIGGNVIDHSENLYEFLKDFTELEGYKILVHGGGKAATKLSDDLGIEAKLIEGRRITGIESLRVVTMVYAGLINKNLVAQLQAHHCNAIGLSGADGNLIKAVKRPVKTVDYGFVGDLDENSINFNQIQKLLEADFVPVFSAITHDGKGQLLNTNADTVASAIAIVMAKLYETRLIYCFEKKGVLADITDHTSVIPEINTEKYTALKAEGLINNGMIPKMDNAFSTLHHGVKEVIIGDAKDLKEVKKAGKFGTKLVL
ncbi:MAG: acetylglutamate kinase [Daejeonella sp.]